jgi:hypothetical protein
MQLLSTSRVLGSTKQEDKILMPSAMGGGTYTSDRVVGINVNRLGNLG